MKKIIVVAILGVALFVMYGMFKPRATNGAGIDPSAQKTRTGADNTGEKPDQTGGGQKDRGGSQKQDGPKPGDTGAGWPYDPDDVPIGNQV